MAQSLNGRLGRNFALRLTDDVRSELESMRDRTAGPRALGPWLVWAARCAFYPPSVLPRRGKQKAMPALRANSGIARSSTWSGSADVSNGEGNAHCFTGTRVILDLCAGTGSWSDPYRLAAGYRVVRVTLPECDVRTFTCPTGIHGILCAPPCTEFSLAKNGRERDLIAGLEVVGACMRLVVGCRPVWWALENPIGLLSRYLGPPSDTWEPYEFGDPWTKPTAVWGNFAIPARGPFVEPTGSAMDRRSAEERAITPDGFARAFFEANP